MCDRSDSFKRKFSALHEVSTPRAFGRDASNPYYDLLYYVALEGQRSAQGIASHGHASLEPVVGQDTRSVHSSDSTNILPEEVLIVELGTCTGGSTSHLAAGSTGIVVSLDIESRPDESLL